MNARRWVFAIWLCFLARAFFYCAALPLWEGFDEWSHFGVVERMAFRGELLVSRDSPLPMRKSVSTKARLEKRTTQEAGSLRLGIPVTSAAVARKPRMNHG